MSRQLRFNDLTGGINNTYDKEVLNSTTKKTETPDMVNVEYFRLGGIKTMEGNTLVGGDKSIQSSAVVGGWEYTRGNEKYMIIGMLNGEVRLYNEAITDDNKFELIYTFPSKSERMSFCNMNNGVVITNGIDDLVFYERLSDRNISGDITIEENSDIVNGTNTLFEDELKVGDSIIIDKNMYFIKEITDNTTLTIDRMYKPSIITYDDKLVDLNSDDIISYNGYSNSPSLSQYRWISSLTSSHGYKSYTYMGSNDIVAAISSDGSGLYSINKDTGASQLMKSLTKVGDTITNNGSNFYILNTDLTITKVYFDEQTSSWVEDIIQPTGIDDTLVTGRAIHYYNNKFLIINTTVKSVQLSNDCVTWGNAVTLETSGQYLSSIMCYNPLINSFMFHSFDSGAGSSYIFYTDFNGSMDEIQLPTGMYGEIDCIIYNNHEEYFYISSIYGKYTTSKDGYDWQNTMNSSSQSAFDFAVCIDNEYYYFTSTLWSYNYRNTIRKSVNDTLVNFTNNINYILSINDIVLTNTNNDTSYTVDETVYADRLDNFSIRIPNGEFILDENTKDYINISFSAYKVPDHIEALKGNVTLCNATLINTNTDVDVDGSVKVKIRGLAIQYYKGRLYVGTKQGLFYSPIGEYNNWNIQDDAGAFYDIYNDSSEVTALGLYSDYMLVHKKYNTYLLSDSGIGKASESIRVNPFSNITCDSQQSWIVSNTKYFVYSKEFMDIYPLVQRTIYNDRFLGEPITQKVRELFKDVETYNIENIFCVSRPKERQMIFYFPTTNVAGSGEALIFDFQTKSWLLRRLPNRTEVDSEGNVTKYITDVTCAFVFDNDIYIGTRDGLVLKEFTSKSFKVLVNGEITEEGLHAYYKSPWFDWIGNYYQSFAEFFIELNSDYRNRFVIRTQKDGTSRYEDRLIDENRFLDKTKTLVWDNESKHWGGINQETDTEYKDDKWAKITFDTLRMLLPNNVFESFQFELKADRVGDGFHIYQYGFRRIEAEEAPW
jgi:hypothetical protein